MQIAIISTALAIVLFLCLYLGFRTGLKLGMQAAKGVVPEIKNPIIAIQDAVNEAKDHVEQVEADKLFREGFNNIFSYDGNKKE
jgi:hypothetical protein